MDTTIYTDHSAIRAAGYRIASASAGDRPQCADADHLACVDDNCAADGFIDADGFRSMALRMENPRAHSTPYVTIHAFPEQAQTVCKPVLVTGSRPLFCQYPGQFNAQPAYLEIDLRDGEVTAGYYPDNMVPFSVWHGHVIREAIPATISLKDANRLIKAVAAVAGPLVDAYESVWDGNNHVARIESSASLDAARAQIDALIDEANGHEG